MGELFPDWMLEKGKEQLAFIRKNGSDADMRMELYIIGQEMAYRGYDFTDLDPTEVERERYEHKAAICGIRWCLYQIKGSYLGSPNMHLGYMRSLQHRYGIELAELNQSEAELRAMLANKEVLVGRQIASRLRDRNMSAVGMKLWYPRFGYQLRHPKVTCKKIGISYREARSRFRRAYLKEALTELERARKDSEFAESRIQAVRRLVTTGPITLRDLRTSEAELSHLVARSRLTDALRYVRYLQTGADRPEQWRSNLREMVSLYGYTSEMLGCRQDELEAWLAEE